MNFQLKGATLLLTGLPAAGKTTLAHALAEHVEHSMNRRVTLLDGDEVRRLFSHELGYSRQDRRINVLRHAYIAAEVCRHGGIAICALIAPYASDRAEMRRQIAPFGHYVEIHVATPLAVCEQRDPKGLYAKARNGYIKNLTGVDDPYEQPEAPDVTIDTSRISVADATRQMMLHLEQLRD